MNNTTNKTTCSYMATARLLPAVTAALAAAGLIGSAQAQLQTAGSLLVNVDATSAPLGSLSSITNSGTQGGFFEARGGAGATPVVGPVNGNGTRAMRLDGGDYLQHVSSVGGAVLGASPSLTGVNPTMSVEAWVLNPSLSQEETIVAWGHRGSDGRNMSFNYGWDAAWGAVGHWGGADIGWDSSSSSAGFNPSGNPVPGVWHHLVYTFDGATQKLYADGVLKNTEAVGLDIFPIPAVCIGGQYDDDSVVAGGLRGSLHIARLRIHSEALTDGQVLNNYNFERGGFSDGGAPLPFGPTHRYSFNNASGAASAGAVISDSVGTKHGVVRGSGATFTGSRLSLPGGGSGTAAYVDLPNGLLSSLGAANGGPGEITIEGFVKNNGSRNWGRVFDFGGGSAGEVNDVGGSFEGQDYLFLSASEGSNPYVHILSLRNIIPPAGSDIGSGWGTDRSGRDYHFAVTWKEATGEILAYENGSLVGGMNVNPANDKLSTIQDVNVWLGRSNWSGDDNFQGEYDEFRVYPRVLPAEQVKASFDAGANNLATADPVSIGTQPQNQTANELGNATFGVNALGYPVIGYQWFRAPASVIAGANANSLTLNSIPLSDNGAQFFCVASNFIPGTGSFFATSQVATLTVNADLTPPTLASAAAAGVSDILVTFSEPVDAADAADAINYEVRAAGTNLLIVSAVSSGPRAARLTVNAPFGCAYYEVTVNNVRDVSTAQNPVAPNSKAGFLSLATPSLTHRYTFNNTPTATAAGTSVPNLQGGAPALIKSGGGATTLTGTRVTLAGGGSATAPYVDLPNGLLSNNSTNRGGTGRVTYEAWTKVTGNQSWARLFDFGANQAGEITGPGGGGSEGTEYFFLAAQIGGNTGARRLDLYNGDQGNLGGGGAEYGINNFNQDFQYVVTWEEATGVIQVYENGSLVTSMTTVAPMSDINDVNVWLGRSNWTVDANMQGEYDEFRVYNRLLSASEIAQNAALGPDNSIGAPQSITVNIANTNMNFPGPTQQATALVNFPGGVSLNLVNSGCLTFQSSDPNVLTVSPSGVLTVVTGGVATITASFNGISGSRVVNVLEDVFPPTLVSARVSSPTTIELQYSEIVETATAMDSVNYTVYGADGPVAINTIDLHPSQDRVTLNLFDRLPLGLVTVEVSLVTDTAPRLNEILPGSQISTYYLTVKGLTHRYSFNGTPVANATGGLVPDLAGTADGTVKGNGAAFLGSRLALAGGSSGSAAYVDLPNGLLSINSTNNGGPGAVSVEMWVKVTGVQNWSRIFDIGSSDIGGGVGGEQTGPGGGGAGLDYFFHSAVVGGDRNTRRIELRNEDPAGGGIVTVDYATTNFNVDTHIVVSWDERTGQIRTYQNGTQVATVTTDDAMSQINDVNVWLGRSNWNGDNNMQGEFDEFRIHNRVLPQGEIAFSYALGADPNFGTLNSVTLAGPTTMTATNSQQLSFYGIFANAPGLDLTGTPAVRYTSSDPSVLTVSDAGVAQALRCGSATVTAWIAGSPSVSNTLAVTVLNCPPVATPDGVSTRSGESVTVPIFKFINNDFDPEGAPVLFVNASATSTNGGTVTTGVSDLTYSPAPGFFGIDRFSYTISDGTFTTTTYVEVVVLNSDIPAPNLVGLDPLPGGGFEIRFAGIPGRTYQVQRSTAPNGPWTTVSTLVAPLQGLMEYQDANPPQPSAFYRVILP
ncbi:MAG: hypothetical protein RJA22_812 [Verrucomicrobiota bacterium]|jgi:hypothetical protein